MKENSWLIIGAVIFAFYLAKGSILNTIIITIAFGSIIVGVILTTYFIRFIFDLLKLRSHFINYIMFFLFVSILFLIAEWQMNVLTRWGLYSNRLLSLTLFAIGVTSLIYVSEFLSIVIIKFSRMTYKEITFLIIRNDPDKLRIAYRHAIANKEKYHIVSCLMKLKAEHVIWNLDNPLTVALMLSRDDSYSDFLRRWKWLVPALNDERVFKYFYQICNPSNRLYLMLCQFGYCQYQNIPYPQLTINLDSYLKYTQDAEQLEHKDIVDSFNYVWASFFQNHDDASIQLACLISRDMVNKKIKELIVVTDPSVTINEYKNEYLSRKKSASSRQEIEALLKEEEDKIKRIIDQAFLSKAHTFESGFNSENEIVSLNKPIVAGKLIDIKLLNANSFITSDIGFELSRIQSELDNNLSNIKDSDAIMKAKALATDKEKNLYDCNDLAFTLFTINPDKERLDSLEIAFELALKTTNSLLEQSVLYCIGKSENKYWVHYILEHSGLFHHYSKVLSAIYNKYSVEQLQVILSVANLSSIGINQKTNRDIYAFSNWVRVSSIRNGVFSYDSKWIATESGVYSTYDWRKVSDVINCKSFNHDGKWLAAKLGVFTTYDWQKIPDTEYGEFFSPDGKWLVGGNRLYSTSNWKIVKFISGEGYCFSPDSKWLLSKWGSHEIRVYSTSDWQEVRKISSYKHFSFFSPDGKWLLGDKEVYSTVDWCLKFKYNNGEASLSPDGKWLVIGYSSFGNEGGIYATNNWSKKTNLCKNAIFSPDCKWIATEDGVNTVGKWINVANLKNGKSFSPDGLWLTTSDGIYSTQTWQKATDIVIVNNYSQDGVRHSLDSKFLIDEKGVIRMPFSLPATILNSLVYLRFNLKTDDAVKLSGLKLTLTGNPLSEVFSPILDEFINLAGKISDAVTIDRSNRVESNDVSLGHPK